MFEYLFCSFHVDRAIPCALEEPPFRPSCGSGARNMPQATPVIDDAGRYSDQDQEDDDGEKERHVNGGKFCLNKDLSFGARFLSKVSRVTRDSPDNLEINERSGKSGDRNEHTPYICRVGGLTGNECIGCDCVSELAAQVGRVTITISVMDSMVWMDVHSVLVES